MVILILIGSPKYSPTLMWLRKYQLFSTIIQNVEKKSFAKENPFQSNEIYPISSEFRSGKYIFNIVTFLLRYQGSSNE